MRAGNGASSIRSAAASCGRRCALTWLSRVLGTHPQRPCAQFYSRAAEAVAAGQRHVAGDTCATSGVSFETGRVAWLANGSCTARSGANVVLATAVADRPADLLQVKRRRRNQEDFLQVHFRESRTHPLFGLQRRDALIGDEAESSSKLDHALRPLFQPGTAADTQVCASVLSTDGKTDTDALAINAASAAIITSDIHWRGPVAAVRVADLHGRLVLDPNEAQLRDARLDVLYAGTRDSIVLLEVQAREVDEALVVAAVSRARSAVQVLLADQEALQQGTRQAEGPSVAADPAAARTVESYGREAVRDILCTVWGARACADALEAAREKVAARIRAAGRFRLEPLRVPGSGCVSPSDLEWAWRELVASAQRHLIMQDNVRSDGRGLIDRRPVHCQVGWLPAVHGSALISYGETQVLSTVAISGLPPNGLQDVLDTHYDEPAAASNQVRWLRRPGRKEMEQRAFVERALGSVLPPARTFPFKVRLNMSVLSANGSAAAVAVSSGSLALHNVNVPASNLVTGVTIGVLLHEGSVGPRQWELVTDLQAMEAGACDAELQVARSSKGVTAVRLVCQTQGMPWAAVEAALLQARAAGLQTLEMMNAAVGKAKRRPEGAQFGSQRIAKEHIGRIIGPQGSTIKGLEATTGACISVQDATNELHYFAPTAQQFDALESALDGLTGGDIVEGKTYKTVVRRVTDYGAFVELPNGHQALLHISELDTVKVRSVGDVLQEGDEVDVVSLGRDSRGFLRLSRKALLAGRLPN